MRTLILLHKFEVLLDKVLINKNFSSRSTSLLKSEFNRDYTDDQFRPIFVQKHLFPCFNSLEPSITLTKEPNYYVELDNIKSSKNETKRN